MDSCALFTYNLTRSVLSYAVLCKRKKEKKHAYFVTAGGKCVNREKGHEPGLKSKVQSALQLETQDTMSTSSHTSRTIVYTCKNTQKHVYKSGDHTAVIWGKIIFFLYRLCP